jgi:hypothetical protein
MAAGLKENKWKSGTRCCNIVLLHCNANIIDLIMITLAKECWEICYETKF